MQSRFRRIAVTASAALALVLGAGTAVAQPASAAGPGPWGPHAMGAGGPGAGDAMIGHLIERAKAQLNLQTGQQVAFDRAVALGKTEREAARARHQKVRDALQVQLAAAEPDLAAMTAIGDDVEAQDRAARNGVRAEWLKLYATFTAEQKAVVRDLLQQRIARMDSFRQHMRERIQQRLGATGG